MSFARLLVCAALTASVATTACVAGIGEPNSEGTPTVIEGTVVKVVDGDTLHVVIRGSREKVRLIGIDTPEVREPIEPYGTEATNFTTEAVAGSRVWLETDAELRDRYGRLLAYVWLERPESHDEEEVAAKMLNARLLGGGYANVSTYPPNVRYVAMFRDLERNARSAARGLWAE